MQGKIVTAFIFLTMMTGAVSAAPVLDCPPKRHE